MVEIKCDCESCLNNSKRRCKANRIHVGGKRGCNDYIGVRECMNRSRYGSNEAVLGKAKEQKRKRSEGCQHKSK